VSSSLLQLEALALAGGPPKVCEPIEVLREIVEGDLELLRAELTEHSWSRARAQSGLGQLTALRMGHQQLAQALATGIDPREAAWLTGRSVSSVTSLLTDPAFQELLEYYRANQAERDFNAFERLVTLGGTAMGVLQERIEENPERFSNNELRQLMEASMDRSAAPAKGGIAGRAGGSSPVVVNVKFVESAQRLAADPALDARDVSPREITISSNEED
jgi:hypothetical protein